MNVLRSIFVFLPIMLAGCSIFSMREESPEVAVSNVYDTRAFLLDQPAYCPTTGQSQEVFGAIAGAILVPLLEAGIERGTKLLGDALNEAAASKEMSVSASASQHFYRITATNDGNGRGVTIAPRCLVIVRGEFGSEPADGGIQELWSVGGRKDLAGQIGLAANPDLFIELGIAGSQAGASMDAIKFFLGAVEYRKPLVRGVKDTRDLAVSIVLQAPQRKSEQNQERAFGLGALAIENLQVGSDLGRNALLGKETAWLPLLSLSDPQVEELQVLPVGSKVGPFSAFVTVTETRDASKFLQFLAGVYQGNEEAIKSGAAKIVIDLTGLKVEE